MRIPNPCRKGNAMSIRFVALDSGLVKRLQDGGTDANGQKPERHVCSGGMMPCRHCLADIKAGRALFDPGAPALPFGPALCRARADLPARRKVYAPPR